MKKIFLFSLPLLAFLYQSCKEKTVTPTSTAAPSGSGTPAPTPVEVSGNLNIGSMAPDFTLPTPEGKNIKLSSFKGKVILLDFWAAWCKPCREENPNFVKMYEKYKNKNFDIVSVSLDYEASAWKKAIISDGLIWTNLSDLNYWYSKELAPYEIRWLPVNYLLDTEGKIIATDLRGEQLEYKLEEILK